MDLEQWQDSEECRQQLLEQEMLGSLFYLLAKLETQLTQRQVDLVLGVQPPE